ncbi:hypothetical protein At12D1_21790 [Agrobacterium tumefaciens]|nr:hypothetical protein At12D1_21790 [Agrobacterium tumefaciens]
MLNIGFSTVRTHLNRLSKRKVVQTELSSQH